jgi:site-specific DNA-methyltransferase (adenine-specific)
MKTLPNESIGFICADLPYGVLDYAADKRIDFAKMWEEFRRILKPCSAVALFASGKFSIELAASNLEWYKYKWIWLKNQPTLFVHAKNRPMSKYEEILIFSNGVIAHEGKSKNRMKYNPQGVKACDFYKANGKNTVCKSGGHSKSDARKKFGSTLHASPSNAIYRRQTMQNFPVDVLKFNVPFNVGRAHPNEKPVDLLEYLIKTYSNEGETVLDCTMGSGSTGVAAVNTGRNFIGYELDEKYFKVADERIQKALREKAQRLF